MPVAKDQADVLEFSLKTTKDRLARGTGGRADVFHYLTGEDQAEKAPLTIYELDADVRAVIIAGSVRVSYFSPAAY